MSTLYRKYRPQNFKELVGQNHIKITLEREIETGKIAHAYLFCGPRGIGKTTVARILAKALNCTVRKDGEHEPCGKCNSCLDIVSGRSLDIIEIDAASHTGVDNVRENIIAVSRISPSRDKHKVFIIDEVHMLSTSAFNALLKVLEEPPENVIFILCTTEVHKIPATIISRSQRFDFKRLKLDDITKRMQYIANNEDIKIDKKILEAIARHSEGHMRDALSLLGQIVAIGGKEISPEEADLVIPRSDLNEALNIIGYLAKKDAGSAIELVNKLLDDGVHLKRFISDLIELLRKIMLTIVNPALSDKISSQLGESIEEKISLISRNLTIEKVVVFIEKLMEARNSLGASFITQLPLEMAIISLCRTEKVNPINNNLSASRPAQAGVLNNDQKQAPIAKESTVVSAEINSKKIDKKLIMEKWHEVLAKVKKHNHSLSFILRACEPRDLNGRQLCLAFKYKFHRDRVGDAVIKSLVENTINEVYGCPILIEAIVDETIKVKNGNGNGEDVVISDTDAKADPGESNNAGSGVVKDESESAPTTEEKPDAGNNMIENLLKTFGGKVVP